MFVTGETERRRAWPCIILPRNANKSNASAVCACPERGIFPPSSEKELLPRSLTGPPPRPEAGETLTPFRAASRACSRSQFLEHQLYYYPLHFFLPFFWCVQVHPIRVILESLFFFFRNKFQLSSTEKSGRTEEAYGHTHTHTHTHARARV